MRNKIITRGVMVLILSGLMFLTFSIGSNLAQAMDEPQAVTDTNTNVNASLSPSVECRVVATHTIEYIEKPVIEVKYIEQVESIPVELVNFAGLDELKLWLEERNNVTTIRFQLPDTIIDCDDYALELQNAALADGYMMSFQIIEPDKYNNLFKISRLPSDTLHAINLVLIDNAAYYVEPQTGETVLAAYLD